MATYFHQLANFTKNLRLIVAAGGQNKAMQVRLILSLTSSLELTILTGSLYPRRFAAHFRIGWP
jgi:hypothetical protein